MRFLSRSPAAPLDDFVDYFWALGDVPPHSRERIVPSGTVELVVNLREDEIRIYDGDRCRRYSGAVVSGVFSGFFVVDTLEHADIVGVHFKPGGAFPFFDVPLGELADAHVELHALWGRDAGDLRERLCAQTAPARRFALLERALLAHLYRPLDRRGEVRFALDQLGRSDARVRDVAGRVNLSHRRFIEIFAEEIGATPKSFHRLRRFQRALARLRRCGANDWACLALECGYFDQSHLIREFLAFSGFAPHDYLSHLSERVKAHHLALPGS